MAWDDDSYFEGAGTPYAEVAAGWAKEMAAPYEAALAEAAIQARAGDGHCAVLARGTPSHWDVEWLPCQPSEKCAEHSAAHMLHGLFAAALGSALPDDWRAQEFAAGTAPRLVRKERDAWAAMLKICRDQFEAGQPITGAGSQDSEFSDNRFAALAAFRR